MAFVLKYVLRWYLCAPFHFTYLKPLRGRPAQQGNYESNMGCFKGTSVWNHHEDDPAFLQPALLSEDNLLLLSVQGAWVNIAVAQSVVE